MKNTLTKFLDWLEDNWLLENKAIQDFFEQVFNKREFNVKVSENY